LPFFKAQRLLKRWTEDDTPSSEERSTVVPDIFPSMDHNAMGNAAFTCASPACKASGEASNALTATDNPANLKEESSNRIASGEVDNAASVKRNLYA